MLRTANFERHKVCATLPMQEPRALEFNLVN
jgi:hypothetical protein